MKLNKLYLVGVLFSISLILFSTGCKRKGCTLYGAINYDPKAKIEDYSCISATKIYFGLTGFDEYANRLSDMVQDTPLVIQVIYKDKIVKNLYLNSLGVSLSYSIFSTTADDSGLFVIDTFLVAEQYTISLTYKEIHGYFELNKQINIYGKDKYSLIPELRSRDLTLDNYEIISAVRKYFSENSN